jgi:hypothetical protein
MSFAGSAVFFYQSIAGAHPSWGLAAFMLVAGAFGLLMCLAVPGVLTISDEGIATKRRFGTQTLRWNEIESARWAGHGTGAVGGLASMASDNWQLWIKGSSAGKPVTMVFSGPGVERQREVRDLLAARLPKA